MNIIETMNGRGIGYKQFKTDPDSLQKFMRRMELVAAAVELAPSITEIVTNDGDILTHNGQVVTHTPLYKNIPIEITPP